MKEVFGVEEFETAFYYDGNDLGSVYTKEATHFRVWAPTASRVLLHLYKEGAGDNLITSIDMKKDVGGTWYYKAFGDLDGVYYTYLVTVGGVTQEAVDIYARAVGVNGMRGMVVDLKKTNPLGWAEDKPPLCRSMTDAIIYELHIRDLSSDIESGILHKGKYLGLTEKGTVNSEGLSTGLSHLIELGITHLHLLPAFDYSSVDEAAADTGEFNWGYDPENYNVPEGSYSTNPYRGEVRIREFKEMVHALHNNNISVVMDVVYNHTAKTIDSNFNKIVPDYYYRKEGDRFSNGSGCGNETASERVMVRKFIVDSVVYWATEYKIDGFRFDLMALHDIDTMNQVREALDKVRPNILIYGEGWTGGHTPLPMSKRALKINASSLNNIALFSDDMRDGIKGSVFAAWERGFVNGRWEMEETIKFGIVASTEHTEINYSKVNYSHAPWAASPTQTINYASAHDNLSLWDKLSSSNKEDSILTRIQMNKLASAIILTAQGIPFFQAGEEILRSKVKEDGTFDHNSYKSSDFVNSIKWGTKGEAIEVYNYYKGLIAFRKAHPSLRMKTTKEIQERLTFIRGLDANVVAFWIRKDIESKSERKTHSLPLDLYVCKSTQMGAKDDREIFVIHNANRYEVEVDLPAGSWDVYIDGEKAGLEALYTIGEVAVISPISALVLVKS